MHGKPRKLNRTIGLSLLSLVLIACHPESSETIEIGTPSQDDGRREISAPTRQVRGQAATDENNDDGSLDQEKNPTASGFNQRFAFWFGNKTNYDLVYQDVLGFYPEGRYNGCVAFLSAALRRMGVSIPIRTASTESPSLVTKPFSNYLENTLGWRRIGGAMNLQPGDIVFTKDNPSYPGYPAHTYMFQAWSNKWIGVALVVDNQDFTHERNIYSSGGGFNFTPYAYALRAP